MKTILISGGKGKFAKTISEINSNYKIISPSKKEMNVKKLSSILNFINRKKIDYFIHSAAFSTLSWAPAVVVHNYGCGYSRLQFLWILQHPHPQTNARVLP